MTKKYNYDPYRAEREENSFLMSLFTQWWVLVLLLIFLSGVAYAALRPTLLNMEADANQASFQYQDARNDMAMNWISDYRANEVKVAEYTATNSDGTWDAVIAGLVTQNDALLTQICNEVADIDASNVNDSITTFLINVDAPCASRYR